MTKKYLPLSVTGPGAGRTPSVALRRGNIPASAKARSLELAPGELLKTMRRWNRLEVRLGR